VLRIRASAHVLAGEPVATQPDARKRAGIKSDSVVTVDYSRLEPATRRPRFPYRRPSSSYRQAYIDNLRDHAKSVAALFVIAVYYADRVRLTDRAAPAQSPISSPR
jgi:hypothetical protein